MVLVPVVTVMGKDNFRLKLCLDLLKPVLDWPATRSGNSSREMIRFSHAGSPRRTEIRPHFAEPLPHAAPER